MCVCAYLCVYVCLYVLCISVCVYVFLYVCLCIVCLCAYVYVYVCVYLCVYVCFVLVNKDALGVQKMTPGPLGGTGVTGYYKLPDTGSARVVSALNHTLLSPSPVPPPILLFVLKSMFGHGCNPSAWEVETKGSLQV